MEDIFILVANLSFEAPSINRYKRDFLFLSCVCNIGAGLMKKH